MTAKSTHDSVHVDAGVDADVNSREQALVSRADVLEYLRPKDHIGPFYAVSVAMTKISSNAVFRKIAEIFPLDNYAIFEALKQSRADRLEILLETKKYKINEAHLQYAKALADISKTEKTPSEICLQRIESSTRQQRLMNELTLSLVTGDEDEFIRLLRCHVEPPCGFHYNIAEFLNFPIKDLVNTANQTHQEKTLTLEFSDEDSDYDDN